MVRLVKGAYWDTEVKRAQERGLADYPVFTRKAMTDLCYLHCTRKLLAARPRLYPQFATHNALTVASVIEDAGGVEGYEFQRLHGMGEVLYETLARRICRRRPCGSMRRSAAIAICWPIWCAACSRTARTRPSWRSRPILRCRSRPSSGARRAGSATRSMRAIRKFRCRAISTAPSGAIRPASSSATAPALRPCWPRSVAPMRSPRLRRSSTASARAGVERQLLSPIDGSAIGRVREGDDALARAAMAAAQAGFAHWQATPVDERAAGARARGRSPGAAARPPHRADAGAKAARRSTMRSRRCARRSISAATTRRRRAARSRREPMPGPTGESNELRYRGRGVFVCISPWNFPLVDLPRPGRPPRSSPAMPWWRSPPSRRR